MKNKTDLTFRHDRLFKEIWSHSENARSFLENYLPKDLLGTMDLNTLELQKDSFVEEDLKEFHSDLLYRVKTSKGQAFVYILFEHKSYPDDLIHLQLLKYMTGIWSLSKKQAKTEKLYPIIPLVLYHGSSAWEAPVLFSDMFSPTEKEIASYIPDFRYLLYDLSKYRDDEITGAIVIRIVILKFKYVTSPVFQEKLPEIMKLFGDFPDHETYLNYNKTLLRYIFTNSGDMDSEKFLNIIKESIPGKQGEEAMEVAKTLAERILNDGINIGKKQGLQNTIIDVFEVRFGNTEQLELIKREIKSIDNIERLENIKNAVKTCKTAGEIISMLGN